jgi:hypothetical protein
MISTAEETATATSPAPAAEAQPKARNKAGGAKNRADVSKTKGRSGRKATGWQAHSVRGFLSGTIGKKMGLTVTSTKGEDGERRSSISR